MAESSLSLTYSQLRQQVAHFLAYGLSESAWTDGKKEVIDLVIQSGIRQFYHPPIVAGTSHQWSFLRPTTTMIVGPAVSGTLVNAPVLHGGHLATIVATEAIFDSDVANAYIVFDESQNRFLITEYLSDTTIKASYDPSLTWGTPIVEDTIDDFNVGGGRTQITATEAIFLPDMADDYIEFDATSTRYLISGYASSTVVWVDGDAETPESSSDTIRIERDITVDLALFDTLTHVQCDNAVFREDMEDDYLRIGGTAYVIESYIDATAVWITGDATAGGTTDVSATIEIGGTASALSYDSIVTWISCDTETSPAQNALLDMYLCFPGVNDAGIYQITSSQWYSNTETLLFTIDGDITIEFPDPTGMSIIVAQKAFLSVGVPVWGTDGLSTVTGPSNTFVAADRGNILIFLESQNKYEIVEYVGTTQVKVAGNAGGEEGAQNCAVIGPVAQAAGDTFTLDGYRGEDYLLPDDFGGIEGQLTFAEGEGRPSIPQVAENQIRTLRQRDISAAQPQYFAVRPKSVAAGEKQRFQLLLWPEPDTVYNLSYTKVVLPNKLSEANPYPLGGMAFSEVVLESCLSVAEQRVNDDKGLHWSQFMERLTAAVIHDREAIEPQHLGYCGDNSDAVLEGGRVRRMDNFYVTYEGSLG